MKKIIIGFSSLIVLIFLIIFAVNAQDNDKEVKKAQSEVSEDCSSSSCDPAKCASMQCDKTKCKEEISVPVSCETKCKDASHEMKCEPVKCNSQKADKK